MKRETGPEKVLIELKLIQERAAQGTGVSKRAVIGIKKNIKL